MKVVDFYKFEKIEILVFGVQQILNKYSVVQPRIKKKQLGCAVHKHIVLIDTNE